MKLWISKSRARRAKARLKNAERSSSSTTRDSMLHRPATGILLACVMWLSLVFLCDFGSERHFLVDRGYTLRLFADALYLLVGMGSSAALLKVLSPRLLHDNSRLCLIFLCTLLSLVPVRLLVLLAPDTGDQWLQPSTIAYLSPLAVAPLLITMLLNVNAGLATGAWVTLSAAALGGYAPSVVLCSLTSTLVVALTATRVRTRAKVFRIGMLISAAEFACLVVLSVMKWESWSTQAFAHQTLACIIGGSAAAILTLLFLPLLESVFKITTDITLLELSDLGHPLLHRLAMEAPGTYHHSLLLASLSQAAADEIGANGLLARVCAYYHDIGKLTKPEFFTENMSLRDNPHDDLTPSMSTLVITSHVKEGVSLAMLHKLPKPIIDVIQEHHGTGLVSFFHHKARQQMEIEQERANGSRDRHSKVEEGTFRYAGPLPHSRESAIIALADAVEGASRSLDKPTPGSIEGLVNEIIDKRVRDGQLNQCQLTFEELTRIRRSFVFSLTNMMHGRIPYPRDDDRDQQPAARTPNTNVQPPTPGGTLHGPGPSTESH